MVVFVFRFFIIAALIGGPITRALASERSISTKSTSPCQALELAEGPPEYNKLVCDGIEYMASARYSKAIAAFENALKIPLHEVPNVALFSRLALAYHENGNKEKAHENLEKARLSLSLLVGILHCVETEQGFGISEGGKIIAANRYADDVASRMCGAAYESLYEQKSLEAVVSDAEFIKLYFEIRKAVK